MMRVPPVPPPCILLSHFDARLEWHCLRTLTGLDVTPGASAVLLARTGEPPACLRWLEGRRLEPEPCFWQDPEDGDACGIASRWARRVEGDERGCGARNSETACLTRQQQTQPAPPFPSSDHHLHEWAHTCSPLRESLTSFPSACPSPAAPRSSNGLVVALAHRKISAFADERCHIASVRGTVTLKAITRAQALSVRLCPCCSLLKLPALAPLLRLLSTLCLALLSPPPALHCAPSSWLVIPGPGHRGGSADAREAVGGRLASGSPMGRRLLSRGPPSTIASPLPSGCGSPGAVDEALTPLLGSLCGASLPADEPLQSQGRVTARSTPPGLSGPRGRPGSGAHGAATGGTAGPRAPPPISAAAARGAPCAARGGLAVCRRNGGRCRRRRGLGEPPGAAAAAPRCLCLPGQEGARRTEGRGRPLTLGLLLGPPG